MSEDWKAISPRQNLFVAGIYLLAGWLGLSFAFSHQSVSPVWPPTGVAFAAIWLLGRQAWVGLLLGSFLTNTLFTEVGVLTSLAIAIGNTIASLCGTTLVRRFTKLDPPFQRRWDMVHFLSWGCGLAPLLSASFGVVALFVGRQADWIDATALWTTWWLGDAVGCLLVAPLLLTWAKVAPRAHSSKIILEGLLCFALLVFVAGSRFGLFSLFTTYPPQAMLLIPVLAWSAMRLGPLGTSTSLAIYAFIAIQGTLKGNGPFGGYSPNQSLMLLQIMLGCLAMTFLSLCAVVEELRAAELSAREGRTRLLQQQQELERSNQELEQFAFVASHDLQEPLRVVSIYAQLLSENYGDKLPEDGHRLVEGMVEGSQRMSRLVDDLLAYSRAGAGGDIEWVSCEKALGSALQNLKLAIQESEAVVEYGELPRVRGNFAQIVQLFQNLVGNAIKYRSKDRPVIRVTAESRDEGWVFSVRDNGIGFDSQYSEKIFRPFQRLHTRETYPGTGIGLATCMKIIQRRGGRIWAESKEGEGSIFFFSFPHEQGGPLAAD